MDEVKVGDLQGGDMAKAYPGIVRGRTIESWIEGIKMEGVMMPSLTLRNSVLGGIEVRTKKQKAENVIKIGCGCFGTILIVRFYCLLLQELGLDYVFLRKEYCCLAPAARYTLMQHGDRVPVDEVARKLLAENNDRARELGAKNMVYFCPQCCFRAKWLMADCDIKQIYAFDLLTSAKLWEGKRLRLDKKVGYLSVGDRHLRLFVPEPVPAESVGLPWKDYRKLLDRVEGLTVVDLVPPSSPQGDEVVWEQMRQHDLDTLVLDHPVAYGGYMRKAPTDLPGTKVRYLADILLQALGWTPWG